MTQPLKGTVEINVPSNASSFFYSVGLGVLFHKLKMNEREFGERFNSLFNRNKEKKEYLHKKLQMFDRRKDYWLDSACVEELSDLFEQQLRNRLAQYMNDNISSDDEILLGDLHVDVNASEADKETAIENYVNNLKLRHTYPNQSAIKAMSDMLEVSIILVNSANQKIIQTYGKAKKKSKTLSIYIARTVHEDNPDNPVYSLHMPAWSLPLPFFREREKPYASCKNLADYCMSLTENGERLHSDVEVLKRQLSGFIKGNTFTLTEANWQDALSLLRIEDKSITCAVPHIELLPLT